MKISFCTIGFMHRPMLLEDMIFIISILGYDGVEIWGRHLKGHETSLQKIKRLVDNKGLKVSMLSPYFDFTSTQRRWIWSIEEAKKFINFAVELDCPLIRYFSGQIGSKYATAKQWRKAIEGLRCIAELAEKEKITIAIETHPNTLADTVFSTLKLIEEVDMKNVKINIDFYNIWEYERRHPLEIIELLYHHTIYIHAKNANLNGCKVNQFDYVMDKNRELLNIRCLKDGELDYDIILKELLRREYNGYIAIECFETRRNPIRVAEDEILFIKSGSSPNNSR